MNRSTLRNAVRAGALTLLFATTAQALAEDKATMLFKIVTVKDEIVVGFSSAEMATLGGNDAGAVARALTSKGELTVWQYAVKKADSGDLQQAPLRKVAVLAHSSLRVEPYASPLKVLPHE